MNDPKLIKSLAIAWPTIDRDYPYAVAILKQLGRPIPSPGFPHLNGDRPPSQINYPESRKGE